MAQQYDLIVLGGGSGGIATARRAAQHGARVALIEESRLGGTCVNVGCVPKKVMWHAADLAAGFRDAADYGFAGPAPRLDWAALVTAREAYIQRLNGIYAANLEKDGVTVLRERGRLLPDRRLQTDRNELRADHMVIATGGLPRWPEIPGSALGTDSDGFFAWQNAPATVAVVGSGYIAVELASLLQTLGAQVTLLLRRDAVLRQFEPVLGQTLLEEMAATGVQVCTEVQVTALGEGDGGVRAALSDGSEAVFERLIWAIGRMPNSHDIGLERAGVALHSDATVAVDDYQNTNVDGVHALGDVTGHFELTPVAIAAGRRLADRLFGGQPDSHLGYENIPTVVFSHPPIGTVGLTEAQARARHDDVVVYASDFVNLRYGVMRRKPRTRMRLICAGADERIIGVHAVGDGADEMLQGFAVALRMGATKAGFDDTVAIHPTAAEEMVTMTRRLANDSGA
ncbi:MAG: glutathione-disulfide reductase [Salinisphaera sp.]|nr:glutathione-disulfide reductase [Salinisphaera sp.]